MKMGLCPECKSHVLIGESGRMEPLSDKRIGAGSWLLNAVYAYQGALQSPVDTESVKTTQAEMFRAMEHYRAAQEPFLGSH